MEELHTDSIDGGHEGQLWARSRAGERAYSNKLSPVGKSTKQCWPKLASLVTKRHYKIMQQLSYNRLWTVSRLSLTGLEYPARESRMQNHQHLL
jgi:hypothetical protein